MYRWVIFCCRQARVRSASEQSEKTRRSVLQIRTATIRGPDIAVGLGAAAAR